MSYAYHVCAAKHKKNECHAGPVWDPERPVRSSVYMQARLEYQHLRFVLKRNHG